MHFTATLSLVAGWLSFWGPFLQPGLLVVYVENAPMTFVNRTPEALSADFLSPSDTGGNIRHILLGRAGDIRQTIHLLHNLRYVETGQWSPLIEVPEQRLILRPGPDEMISMLVRRL